MGQALHNFIKSSKGLVYKLTDFALRFQIAAGNPMLISQLRQWEEVCKPFEILAVRVQLTWPIVVEDGQAHIKESLNPIASQPTKLYKAIFFCSLRYFSKPPQLRKARVVLDLLVHICVC